MQYGPNEVKRIKRYVLLSVLALSVLLAVLSMTAIVLASSSFNVNNSVTLRYRYINADEVTVSYSIQELEGTYLTGNRQFQVQLGSSYRLYINDEYNSLCFGYVDINGTSVDTTIFNSGQLRHNYTSVAWDSVSGTTHATGTEYLTRDTEEVTVSWEVDRVSGVVDSGSRDFTVLEDADQNIVEMDSDEGVPDSVLYFVYYDQYCNYMTPFGNGVNRLCSPASGCGIHWEVSRDDNNHIYATGTEYTTGVHEAVVQWSLTRLDGTVDSGSQSFYVYEDNYTLYSGDYGILRFNYQDASGQSRDAIICQSNVAIDWNINDLYASGEEYLRTNTYVIYYDQCDLVDGTRQTVESGTLKTLTISYGLTYTVDIVDRSLVFTIDYNNSTVVETVDEEMSEGYEFASLEFTGTDDEHGIYYYTAYYEGYQVQDITIRWWYKYEDGSTSEVYNRAVTVKGTDYAFYGDGYALYFMYFDRYGIEHNPGTDSSVAVAEDRAMPFRWECYQDHAIGMYSESDPDPDPEPEPEPEEPVVKKIERAGIRWTIYNRTLDSVFSTGYNQDEICYTEWYGLTEIHSANWSYLYAHYLDEDGEEQYTQLTSVLYEKYFYYDGSSHPHYADWNDLDTLRPYCYYR